MNKKPISKYREAADRVWEMALEYEKNGHKELGKVMKDLASELHQVAHDKEQENSNQEN